MSKRYLVKVSDRIDIVATDELLVAGRSVHLSTREEVHAEATLFPRALAPAVRTDATASAFFANALDPYPTVRTDATASSFFANALDPAVHTASAVFADALAPAVRTDATASAFFANALDPAVHTDATASAFFANALMRAMLTDATASAFFANALDPAVRTDATASAVFALVLLPAVLALRLLACGSVASSSLTALPRCLIHLADGAEKRNGALIIGRSHRCAK